MANKNLTEMVFILDRSGSMAGLENDTIGGYNSLIEKQKKELLELGAKAASMSGSGSSVFGLFDVHESEIVKKSFEQIKNKYQSVLIFKMINGKKFWKK